MKPTPSLFTVLLAGLSVVGCVLASPVVAQHMHRHGQRGVMNDEVNMPRFRRENSIRQQSDELAVMFLNFAATVRKVEEFPSGIRTVIRSSDPDLMAALVGHEAGTIDRGGRKDDPKIFVRSPTLDIFFRCRDEILSTIQESNHGHVVERIAESPERVGVLQVHPAADTAMGERGMAAVHEMMMQQGRGRWSCPFGKSEEMT